MFLSKNVVWVNQSEFSYIGNINLATKIEVKLSKSVHYCTLNLIKETVPGNIRFSWTLLKGKYPIQKWSNLGDWKAIDLESIYI